MGRIIYTREELLAIREGPGLDKLPDGADISVIREMEELTFFDAGPKPDWAVKDAKPAAFPPARSPAGPANFLRPGGPIRSRLVADGSLPDELPPGRPEMSSSMGRADSWRRSMEGMPADGGRPGERWGPGGPPTP
ncbi:hypothetical protein MNEG_13231, partial [Monoraphidium neglectum]